VCSVFLSKPECFYSSVPAEAGIIAILKYASVHSLCCPVNKKVKSFKQCFYRNSVQCQKLEQVFEVQSFQPWHSPTSFCHSFVALSIIHCWKSAQKLAVLMRQVATVIMETVQLILILFYFKNLHLIELNKVGPQHPAHGGVTFPGILFMTWRAQGVMNVLSQCILSSSTTCGISGCSEEALHVIAICR